MIITKILHRVPFDHKKVSDTDKGVNHDRILLVKENETISDNDEIFEKLNNFFADVAKNVYIHQYEDNLINIDNIDDPIL